MPLDTAAMTPLADDKASPAQGSSALLPAEKPLTPQQRDKMFRDEHQARRTPKGRRVSYGNER